MRKVCITALAMFTVLDSVNFALALCPKRELGKPLYFDRYLSANQNQSCSTRHERAITGFVDPLDQRSPEKFPVSVGTFNDRNGGRCVLLLAKKIEHD
jgi:cytochrome c peroxidase